MFFGTFLVVQWLSLTALHPQGDATDLGPVGPLKGLVCPSVVMRVASVSSWDLDPPGLLMAVPSPAQREGQSQGPSPERGPVPVARQTGVRITAGRGHGAGA